MKLAIAVISNRDHKPAFTKSLCDMLVYTAVNSASIGLKSMHTHIVGGTSILPEGRQQSIWNAQNNQCTHLLSIDDDMLFPVNALEILASRKMPVVGVNYVCKNAAAMLPTAWKGGAQVDSRGKTGIEQVDRIGFGMVLIDLQAIKNIPEPHFEIAWKGELNGKLNKEHPYIPEDFYFCRKLEDHGVRIYVDHDVSQKTGHIGDYAYTFNSYK